MGSADTEEFGGVGGIDLPPVERLDGLENEIRGEALGELMGLFRSSSGPPPTAGARHFVVLRYAPASSMPRPGGEALHSLILNSRQSPFDPTPIEPFYGRPYA